MSVESRVYSSKAPISAIELASTVRKWGLELGMLDGVGAIPQNPPESTLGDHVVLVWDARESATTGIVDAALAKRDKGPIDQLGNDEKVAWCQLSGQPFDYRNHWSKFPDEVEEYEKAVKPEALAKIKGATTRYWLRTGTRPKLCGQLLVGLARILVKVTEGAKD